MTAIQHQASLAEQTVQKIARDNTAKVFKYRRVTPIHEPQRMDYTRVHPRVMYEAHRLITYGSYTRIEIIDERTVMVR